jgi:hypothetical protein
VSKIAKINITLTDKIGLGPPSYSKVEVGVSVSREVDEPGGEEGLAVIKAEMESLSKEVVKPFIASERAKVLRMIQSEEPK